MTQRVNEMAAFADQFFAVYKAADESALREMFAPDFAWWSSAHGKRDQMGIDEMVAGAKWEADNVKLEMTDVRRQYGDDGFVQQSVLRGKGPNGSEFVVPNCMIVTVVDRKITRMDEYVIVPAPIPG